MSQSIDASKVVITLEQTIDYLIDAGRYYLNQESCMFYSENARIMIVHLYSTEFKSHANFLMRIEDNLIQAKRFHIVSPTFTKNHIEAAAFELQNLKMQIQNGRIPGE